MENTLRRILIVEDDADSAEALQIILEMHRHSVRVASDGESAILKAHEFQPDVIICDIGLPGVMSGYDVAAAIREHEHLKSVYLIALSGYGETKDFRQTDRTGFDSHLVKPPEYDKLLSLIENL